jgi:ankyrin repeat protein
VTDLEAHRITPSGAAEDHPIHVAAEAGDVRRLRAYLDADASLVHNANRAGGTPLHRAAIGGSRDAVTLLLDRGADIHAIHGAGAGSAAGYAPQDLQPIDLAIWGGPRHVQPSWWRCVVPMVRWWVWTWWTWNGHPRPSRPAIARLLIERGATYDVPTAAALGDIKGVTAMLGQDGSRIRDSRPNARLALSAAAEFGHMDIVRLLLERGADPTWPDADDSSRGAALHAAARAGNREMVELLLQHGADPNGFVDSAGNAVFAAKTDDIRKLLVAHGGQLDPYDLVWMGLDDEVMRRVTADPASANAGCGGVFTAVVTRGNRTLMTRLLDAGVRVTAEAGGCHSYLLEQPDMLRVLLQRGALDPNYPTADGVTLLHELCSRDSRGRTMEHRTECAAILLDAGAALSPTDKRGHTPLAWARRHRLPDMVEFLTKRGAA